MHLAVDELVNLWGKVQLYNMRISSDSSNLRSDVTKSR